MNQHNIEAADYRSMFCMPRKKMEKEWEERIDYLPALY